MFLKLDKNEVCKKKYQIRKDQINKAQCKNYTENKRNEVTNLNNKMFKSNKELCQY